jgi:hypothetical protein
LRMAVDPRVKLPRLEEQYHGDIVSLTRPYLYDRVRADVFHWYDFACLGKEAPAFVLVHIAVEELAQAPLYISRNGQFSH